MPSVPFSYVLLARVNIWQGILLSLSTRESLTANRHLTAEMEKGTKLEF